MGIVHIAAPARVAATQFETATPPPVDNRPVPTLGTREAFEAPDGSVRTGIWEAQSGEIRTRGGGCGIPPFICGHATFVTEDGQTRFRPGDALLPAPHPRRVDHPRDPAQDLLRLALSDAARMRFRPGTRNLLAVVAFACAGLILSDARGSVASAGAAARIRSTPRSMPPCEARCALSRSRVLRSA